MSTAPINAHWISTPSFDFAAGEYDDGYGSPDNRVATQERRVLFLKPDLLLVFDTMTPHDSAPHAYEARWNLLTTHTSSGPQLQDVTTTDQGVANLVVLPLNRDGLLVAAVSAQTQPELLGWNVRKDLIPEYEPATTVVHAKRAAGVQQFATLLLALKPGERNPIESATQTPVGFAIHLAGGRQITLTVGEGGRGIKWSQVQRDGVPAEVGAVPTWK